MVGPSNHPTKSKIDWANVTLGSVKVSSAVCAQVEAFIRDGSVAVGAKIPPERDLAAMLRVSRGSVREAVQELALRGLVVRKPGVGTVVVPSEAVPSTSIRTDYSPEALTLIRIMDFRVAIEPPIAARAAERAAKADIMALGMLVGSMADIASPSSMVELDERFHRRVAEAAGNPLLVDLIDVSARWLHPSRAVALQSKERRGTSLTGHREILDAIRAGDAVAASEAMERHVRGVATLLERSAIQGGALSD